MPVLRKTPFSRGFGHGRFLKALSVDHGSETSYFKRFGASRKKCKSKEGISSGSAAC